MKHRNLWLLVAGLLVLATPAFADTGGYDVGNIMDKYQTAAQQFGTAISGAALKLCFTLFTIDLVWTVLGRLIKGADTAEIGVAVIFRVMWMGLVLWVMNNPSVPLAFVNGFIQLGKTGANTSVISPGDVFWQGVDLVNVMINSFADNATVAGVPVPAGIAAMANPFAAVLIGTSLLVIIICYAMLAAQFAVAWIQLWFYLAVYPIVLAFGAMKWTKDVAMKVFTTPLVYGVRFMAIYFIIAVGTTLAQDFGNEIAQLSLTNLKPIWTVLAGSVLLFMLTLKVPTLASDLLSGTASLSAGDGAAGALAAGGAIGAAAGAMYAGGSTVANGLAGAIRAGQSAITQAREKGATGLVPTAAGAAGAVGSAIGEATMEKVKGLGSDSAGGRLAERIDSRTASIRESNAASSVSAPSAPGAQPSAPAAPADSPSQGGNAPSGGTAAASTAATETGEATRATPAAPGGAGNSTAGQPAAPAAAAGTTTNTAAPAGGDTATASSSTPAAPASPTSSIIDTSGDINAAKAARDAGQTGMPAAPAAPAEAPAPAAEAPAATTESAAATAADSAPASSSPAAPPAPLSESSSSSASPAAPASSVAPGTRSNANAQDGAQPEAPRSAASTAMAAAQKAISEVEKTGGQTGGSVNINHGGHE
ncbi:P-type conjugative transfer protein TrbL [Ralstonia pseudosolanacearum]|uniref:P-type conjugative transfer protein TrbL n=1 Tax=Ralstonia pseudosolanacearum TaxID=1310165 RepID=UPI001C8B91C2|nr:P-type conjugative transfer protein TrbL [Ralstonia pseudosolanacearum]MBX9431295.1 P-type conjugative transfer protein TrbL [Ralstonia pseudosolanacearum]